MQLCNMKVEVVVAAAFHAEIANSRCRFFTQGGGLNPLETFILNTKGIRNMNCHKNEQNANKRMDTPIRFLYRVNKTNFPQNLDPQAWC